MAATMCLYGGRFVVKQDFMRAFWHFRRGDSICRFRQPSQSYSVSHKYRKKGVATYTEMLDMRRRQADHTVLIQKTGRLSDIYNTCRKYARVRSLFPFTSNKKDFVLVELQDKTSTRNLMDNVQHFSNPLRVTAESRFLFHNSSGSQVGSEGSPSDKIVFKQKSPSDLRTSLNSAKSVSDQMEVLRKISEMPELATRLRHLLCSVLEELLRGLLPHSVIVPFGSSVNGFGRYSCDLDMHFDLGDDVKTSPRTKSGLFFLTKLKNENERLQDQMVLDAISGVISNFFPQISGVRRILKARIPILKFTHHGTSLDCDLSCSNRSATYMSELLYLYGQLDPRVRTLVFTVRHWAQANHITRSNPGPWISNFMLTWMVIFFLQVRPQPLLPPVAQLRKLAVAGELKELNGQDMSFTTDWTKVPASANTETPRDLLLEFFHFYANFNFSLSGISAVEGAAITKPDPNTPFHLENPLERALNAGRNVMEEDLARFQRCCAHSNSVLSKSVSRSQSVNRLDWGLMSVLPNGDLNNTGLNVTMTTLFEDSEDSQGELDIGDTAAWVQGSFSELHQSKAEEEVHTSGQVQGSFSEISQPKSEGQDGSNKPSLDTKCGGHREISRQS